MNTDNIRNDITAWGEIITASYPGLRIRYEYSAARGVFLVSFYTNDIDELDRFSEDVMKFEDLMEEKYGYDAPLFCDNEELFTLSAEADMITGYLEKSSMTDWHIQLDNNYSDTRCFNLAA